jgi:hypothetical protein
MKATQLEAHLKLDRANEVLEAINILNKHCGSAVFVDHDMLVSQCLENKKAAARLVEKAYEWEPTKTQGRITP